MAHDLEIQANGEAAMFSVSASRTPPWHNLGKVVTEAPTTAEAIRLAGLDWSVETRPLFLADGRPVEAAAVVRATDGKVLGNHVGKNWTPLQNAAAFEWFDPFVQSGECSFETAGALAGGSRVWVLATLNRRPIDVGGGDKVKKYLLLSNSHDGSLAVRVGMSAVRIVCANTLALAHNDKGSSLLRLRHTRNLSAALTMVRDMVNTVDASFEATGEAYRKLAATRVVNLADLRKYVAIVLGLKTDEKGELATRGKNILAEVLKKYEGGVGANLTTAAGTWYGAYNAVQDYLAYDRGTDDARRLDSMWFGSNAVMNKNALDLALQMAT